MPDDTRKTRWRKTRIALVTLMLVGVILVGKAYFDTMANPVVRRANVILPGLPAGSGPLRAVLMSDLHVAGPDMPPSRLARIVGQINALHPDVVLIAGDLVSDRRLATRHYTSAASVAPLGKLTARLGVVVVPGNHDHWRNADEITAELRKLGITVLTNEAVQKGPLDIAGLDDDFTGHADMRRAISRAVKLNGGRLVVSHSPDTFPDLPQGYGLMVAGHTHCGQIRYPWGGTPATMSRYGDRYSCGMVRENGNMLIVSAGLGTSVLPFRFGTRPDIWLIELR